jgi:Na+/proline symporter
MPLLPATALVLLLVPSAALAYLNPDSGSMLLQALLGGAAGLAVLVRLYWRRVTGFLSRRRGGPGEPPAAE